MLPTQASTIYSRLMTLRDHYKKVVMVSEDTMGQVRQDLARAPPKEVQAAVNYLRKQDPQGDCDGLVETARLARKAGIAFLLL